MSVRPFSLLVKPASADCNLRCKYCFYLDHCELYPETKIHRMSDETLEQMIKTFMSTNQQMYTFGWQGGEPTIMGVDFFKKVVELQQKYGRPGVRVANGLQTNATLITDEFAQFLAEYNFLVGVSLDGPECIHNQHRLDIAGKGTYDKVLRGIELLKKHKVEFNILTLVSSSNVSHRKEVYNYLKDNGYFFQQYIPCVEFDADGNHLPYSITGKEWGIFMKEVFDEWVKNDTRQISIRLFDSLLSHLTYGMVNVCHMGGNCCQYFVVEYNGDVYPCDFFVEKEKQVGNIFDHTWSEMQECQQYKEFGQLKNNWNKKCSECEHLFYCSGDCLKHRIYNNGDPNRLSWLCEGWDDFYKHSIPKLKELGNDILKMNHRGRNTPVMYIDKKFERNEECFCGSGKKYKHCHGRV